MEGGFEVRQWASNNPVIIQHLPSDARSSTLEISQLCPSLQEQLAKPQVHFVHNPPHAPHFGGTWERKVQAVKTAVRAALGGETVTDEVLSGGDTQCETFWICIH